MNNQSPLIPQGSLLEQKSKTRARVKIAVFFVIALHACFILALLIQGCGHENAGAGPGSNASPNVAEAPPSNPPPQFAPPTNPPEPPPPANTNPAPPVVTNPPPPPPIPTTPPPPEPPGPTAGVSDYKILKGDSFFKLHKKFHVSLKAIQDANPGVDSSKLKIDQVIHIPAATPAPAPTGPGTTTEAPGGEETYVVKSNDNLAKVARQFGVKIKALRAANHLRTDKIRVGQKLKIPPKTEAAASAPSTPSAPPVPPGNLAPAPR